MHKYRMEDYSVNKIVFFHSFATYFIVRSSVNQKRVKLKVCIYSFFLHEKGFFLLTLDLYVHLRKNLKKITFKIAPTLPVHESCDLAHCHMIKHLAIRVI